MPRILFATLAMALTALGADVAGEWKATAAGPDGQPMTRTFKFQTDGAKLTGETESSVVGKSTIDDGRIDGDTLHFTIHIKFQGNEMHSKYRGKVMGKDKIVFKIEGLQGGEDFEWIAKRI